MLFATEGGEVTTVDTCFTPQVHRLHHSRDLAHVNHKAAASLAMGGVIVSPHALNPV